MITDSFEPIEICNAEYVLRSSIANAIGEIKWRIQDPKNGQTFVINSYSSGKLCIPQFKRVTISKNCFYLGIKEICEILLVRGIYPTIKIPLKHNSLIHMFSNVGFCKYPKGKGLYYYKVSK